MVKDHRPRPGPIYWNYRCLVCDEPVDSHKGWLWNKVKRRLRRN